MTIYKLRIGGSNDYISKIDPDDQTCCPPGSTRTVPGISNPKALTFPTEWDAQLAAKVVENIEGFHMSVEEYK